MTTSEALLDLNPAQHQWEPGQADDDRLVSTVTRLPDQPYVLLRPLRDAALTAIEQLPSRKGAGDDAPGAAANTPTGELVVFPVVNRVKQSTQVLHRWEGVVTETHADHFVARVRETTDASRPEERAEIDLESVSREDGRLVGIGAVFYWWIGYRRETNGTVRTFSEVRFRRLPEWTASDLAKLEDPSDLDEIFVK